MLVGMMMVMRFVWRVVDDDVGVAVVDDDDDAAVGDDSLFVVKVVVGGMSCCGCGVDVNGVVCGVVCAIGTNRRWMLATVCNT